MKIPFVGPSGEARSLNQNAERSVNCYLEQNPAPGREWALYGMPGKVLRATFQTSPVRGCIGGETLTYWVAGNTVYTLTPGSGYAQVTLGTIGTSTGRVGMADNGTEVLIVDGTGGWLAGAGSFAAIADVDFPTGVTVALYLDGYFIVFGDGTEKVYWNETPGSGTAWNSLDFASAEGIPDVLVDGVVEGRNLWLFGTHSGELWRSSGDTAAPFQRMEGVFIEHGIASRTAAKMDNSVFWMGSGYAGDGIVFRSNGSAPQRVSTHALETAIHGYSTVADSFAYCMQIAGHSFYVLTFPSADVTWVYDAATSSWSEWAWRDPAANTLHRDRSSCFVFSSRKHLVGDWETGKVYSLELDTYTDNGDAMLFLRRTQALTEENARLFYEETVIDMETGVANADCADPQIMYRYSNDGGHTWSTEKQRSIGAVGQYGQRVKFGPSGSGRNRVHEISITDPVKRAVFGAFARVSKGD
jgi:hypothetical protein